MPETSVVIPVLGRHGELRRTLAALDRQRDAAAFEVIVVPDAAEPDPAAVERLVGSVRAPARMVRAAVAGASGARNAGWRAAAAPVVLFLGADIEACPVLVARHQAAHRRHPERESAVLGHVRWAPGSRITPFMRWLDHGVQFEYHVIAEHGTGWAHLYTANVSLKTDLLAAVDGFDERRFPFPYEDTDLGLRLAPLGLRVHYDPTALGDHHHEQTVASWRARMGQVARAERMFVTVHPEQRPYFRERLGAAAEGRRALGLGRPLAGAVTPRTPLLGRPVWRSIDRYYRRQLAPAFLEAWDRPA